MDLKFFLGDCLDGFDLGGLEKLGFDPAVDIDSDKEEDKQQTPRPQEEQKVQPMPPTLYNMNAHSKVYCLSRMFIPEDGTGKGDLYLRKVREKMVKFNTAIMERTGNNQILLPAANM